MRRLLTACAFALLPFVAWAAIEIVNVASQPPSDPAGGAGYTTDPLTITPPTGMLADDYVVMLLCARAASVTWTNTVTGGQTWTSDTSQTSTTRTCQFWRTKFDGTWTADPAWDASATPNTHSAYMMVFRGVDGTTPVDAAATGSTTLALSAGQSTITGGTTATNGAIAIYCWSSLDDNAWTPVGPTTSPTGTSGLSTIDPVPSPLTSAWRGRIRNQGGSDTSVMCGWKVVATAGASGNEKADENDLGETDAGTWHWIALRPSTATTTTTTSTTSTTNTTIIGTQTITRNPTSDLSETGGTWGASAGCTAGSRWQCLDDHPDTTGADYLTLAGTSGDLACGMSALTIPDSASIVTVRVVYYDYKEGTNGTTVRSVLRVNGTNYANATTHNGTNATYVLRTDTWATNPATSLPWTVNDVNGVSAAPLQGFGPGATDATPTMRFASARLEVDYVLGKPSGLRVYQ